MTSEEYWEKDVELAIGYRKAFEIKQELDNQKMWLQGIYNMKALSVVIGRAFNDKCKDEYFENPIPITEHEKQMETQKSILKTLDWIKRGQEE